MLISRCLRLVGLLLALSWLASCSRTAAIYKQGAREFNRGEYETSLQTTVRSLQRNPRYAKSQRLVKKAYFEALGARQTRVQQIRNAAREDMWDQLTLEYAALIELQNIVKPINPMIDRDSGEAYYFPVHDYEALLADSKVNAAEVHYNRALALSADNDNPDEQKLAAGEFRLALNYVPNYRDSYERWLTARRLAVKRVAILAYEDKSGTQGKYGGLIDLLTDSIIAKMLQDSGITEYMQLITRDQMAALLNEYQLTGTVSIGDSSATALGSALHVHELMTGKILQINYVPSRTTNVEFKETQNIVLGEEKYVTDKGKEKTRVVKGDVSCIYRKYTKTASAKLIASFSMIDVATGRIKLQDTVASDYTWTGVWGRVSSGDDRALSPEAKELCLRDEPFPPEEVEMVNLALNKLCDDIVAKIRVYVQ